VDKAILWITSYAVMICIIDYSLALVHFDGLKDGRMLFPLFGPDRTDAAQAQRRSPSPHPDEMAQGICTGVMSGVSA
jgi:hypothetical protein